MVTDETWSRNYDLVFSIEDLLAECELLTADMSAAENRLSKLVERAKNAHDIATCHTFAPDTLYDFVGSDRGDGRVHRIPATSWHGLVATSHRRRSITRIRSIWSSALVESRKIEQLVDLPLITNPDVLDVLDVFAIVMAAMFTDANLHALVLCRMVSLSLEHGNSDASCFAYVSLGMVAGPSFREL